MIELGRIVEIVTDWASDDSDGIDDLDALCQIAEVLGIEVQARDSVEAPKLCGICIAAGRVYCPPEHSSPEQQSPRVCVKCNHAEHWSSNHHHRCAFLYTSMDGGSTCSCMCVFPESVEEKHDPIETNEISRIPVAGDG